MAARLILSPVDSVALPTAVFQVNPCKKKALTNMRAAGKDATVVISEPIPVTLDYALEVSWSCVFADACAAGLNASQWLGGAFGTLSSF